MCRRMVNNNLKSIHSWAKIEELDSLDYYLFFTFPLQSLFDDKSQDRILTALSLPHTRNTFSLLLEGNFICHISEMKSFLGVSCTIIEVGGEGGWVGLGRKDGRRLGGPVDWKMLPPGRESVRGSICTGANVATASLELWCKEHCVMPSTMAQRVWKRSHLNTLKQTEDYPAPPKTNPSIWVRHCHWSEIGLL